jgi:hypothetical protein
MTMNTEEQIEPQFATAIADYIRRFNMLENNIGYSVRWMKRSDGNGGGAIESTFHGKLSQFKELISQRSLEPFFAEWFTTVDCCRALRNNIVHGHWEVLPHLDKPIRFDTQRPGQSEAQREQGDFTLQEFLKQLSGIVEASDTFSKLRQSHGI